MPLSNKLSIGALVLALIGFLDATYLTIEVMANKIPPCTVGSCEQVLTSRYAHVFGIPVALLGLLFYVTLVLLLIAAFSQASGRLYRWAAWLMVIGFVVSLWLLYAQFALIGAFCQYCLLSELVCFVLFPLAIRIFKITNPYA